MHRKIRTDINLYTNRSSFILNEVNFTPELEATLADAPPYTTVTTSAHLIICCTTNNCSNEKYSVNIAFRLKCRTQRGDFMPLGHVTWYCTNGEHMRIKLLHLYNAYVKGSSKVDPSVLFGLSSRDRQTRQLHLLVHNPNT